MRSDDRVVGSVRKRAVHSGIVAIAIVLLLALSTACGRVVVWQQASGADSPLAVAVASSGRDEATPARERRGTLLPAVWAPAPRLRPDAAPPPIERSAAAVLLDEGSAATLYEREPDVPLPPASLTKIATAIVALEQGNLNDWVTVDVDSRVMRGSTVMGLVPGDRFTLRDLLLGMMLPSGNDAALAVARHVAGSDAEFVARMNELLARLGLEGHFANPHGLNGVNHAIPARDLALLTRYAMTFPEFRTIVSTPRWTADGARAIPFANLMNGMLAAVPGADGVKSGFTRSAGRTIVVSAMRDGHRLYAVLLNDAQREADAAALLEWGFASFEWAPQSLAAAP